MIPRGGKEILQTRRAESCRSQGRVWGSLGSLRIWRPPRDEPYLSEGASISSASCSYFLPLSMLPHSYPHICSWACRLILSLPNPLLKVINDKWTISSQAESEGGFLLLNPLSFVFHLTGKNTEHRTWTRHTIAWFIAFNQSQLSVTQVITQYGSLVGLYYIYSHNKLN